MQLKAARVLSLKRRREAIASSAGFYLEYCQVQKKVIYEGLRVGC